MDLNQVINFMNQQLKPLKELEDLIKYNEKQEQTHSVNPNDIEALKGYVTGMKQAVTTAKTLAEHYKKVDTAPVENRPAEETVTPEEPKEKPKRTRTKKEDPPAEEPKSEEENFDFLD